MKSNLTTQGSIVLLFALLVNLGLYFHSNTLLYYLVFISVVYGIFIFFKIMYIDLKQEMSKEYAFVLIAFIVVIYFLQRTHLNYFIFSVTDASDYYLSGVNSITKGEDIGFFLPLTASLMSLGFLLFGHEYALYILVLLYVLIIPLLYKICRKLEVSALNSYVVTLLFISLPLSIWYSKTSFSEGYWQILLLLFIIIAHIFMLNKKISFLQLAVMANILFLLPFSRGESSIFYLILVCLSLYHLWKYRSFISSFIYLCITTLVLSIGLFITMTIRGEYLKWQFSRILPNMTNIDFSLLLVAFTMSSLFLLVIVYVFKNIYENISFPKVIVVLSLFFKVLIAYIFTSKKHMSFFDLVFYNEFHYAQDNFGILLTLLMLFGLILLYLRAFNGNSMALLLICMYVVLYLPFTMQATPLARGHEFFFYWYRYYFSFISIVHIVSFALSIEFIHKKLKKIILKKMYFSMSILGIFVVIFLFFINKNLYIITYGESYLSNSYRIFSWIKDNVGNKSINIIYASNIRYNQLDAKLLIGRGLEVDGVNVKHFYQIKASKFRKRLILPYRMYDSEYVICLSKRDCILNDTHFKKINEFEVDISWYKQNSKLSDGEQKRIIFRAYLFEHRKLLE